MVKLGEVGHGAGGPVERVVIHWSGKRQLCVMTGVL